MLVYYPLGMSSFIAALTHTEQHTSFLHAAQQEILSTYCNKSYCLLLVVYCNKSYVSKPSSEPLTSSPPAMSTQVVYKVSSSSRAHQRESDPPARPRNVVPVPGVARGD
jgi:hypothetical protein